MQVYNSRNDVPEKYKWDLTDFFKDEKEYEQGFKECIVRVDELKDYVGCTKDAKRLYEFVMKEVETIALFEDLYVYAYLINDQELGISKNMERLNRVEDLNAKLVSNTSFFAPELLQLSNEEFEQLFVSNQDLEEARASLLHIYRDKEHVLDEEKEKIVAELTNAMDHFSNMSSTLLNNQHYYGKVKNKEGVEEEITTTNLRRLMKNDDATIRKEVRESFSKVIDQYGTTSAGFLNSYVKMQDTLAKIYHFDNAWERKLFTLNMPRGVYTTLVRTVEKNTNSLRRFYNIKATILGLDKLHAYDLNLDIGDKNKEYSIEEAQKMLRVVLQPLGDEYLDCFDKIINRHYIDYCQYKGKCSGGYSFDTLRQDSRILMSFNGDLTSISTIVHESGHNVHGQMIKKNNSMLYRGVSSLVCEVASLTNECLLSSYLAEHGNTKEEKMAGIANILEVIVSNLYGAVREGRMEEEMYHYVSNGGTLTKEYLDQLTIASLDKYRGDAVVGDEYSKNGWVTRSHYFMNFYLYSYAICISVASNVACKILSGDSRMLESYMKFLKTGSDVWPYEAFQILGVNLLDPSVYEGAIAYFDKMMDKLEEIVAL